MNRFQARALILSRRAALCQVFDSIFSTFNFGEADASGSRGELRYARCHSRPTETSRPDKFHSGRPDVKSEVQREYGVRLSTELQNLNEYVDLRKPFPLML